MVLMMRGRLLEWNTLGTSIAKIISDWQCFKEYWQGALELSFQEPYIFFLVMTLFNGLCYKVCNYPQLPTTIHYHAQPLTTTHNHSQPPKTPPKTIQKSPKTAKLFTKSYVNAL